MRVLSYSAHNVMRARDIKFDLDGYNLFIVGGENANGKTSSIRALLMALCGRSGMEDYPEIALREGENEGWVKVDLSGDTDLHDLHGFTVELHLERKRDGSVKEELRVLDSTGEAAPSPRTLLKSLYSLKAFDPLAFERLDRKAKKELLQKMLGLDFEKHKQAFKKLYDERTILNREGAALKAKFDKMPHHPGVVEVVTADLLEELQRRQQCNQQNREARAALETRRKLVEENRRQAEKIRKQIEDLQTSLAALDREHIDLAARYTEQQTALAQLVDQSEAEVLQKLKEADGVNAKARQNKDRGETGQRLQELTKQRDKLEEGMQAIESAQSKALQEAAWPVPGLSLDDEGVLFEGLPFEQASKAQRVLVSVMIGMALNPKLRLLVCEDGSALDQHALDALDTMLSKNGFQMIVEMVTRTKEDEGRCAVVIQDGEVAGAIKEIPAVTTPPEVEDLGDFTT